MKATIHSTDRLIDVTLPDGNVVPGRIWEGRTESGLWVSMLVTRVATRKADDQSQFERELKECEPPSRDAIAAIPLRFIL